jgi:hypothetical protein
VTYAREHAATETKTFDLSRLEREFLERHMLSWAGLAYKKLQECPMPAFRVLFCLRLRLHRKRQERLARERP